jgi:hypothetical protein
VPGRPLPRGQPPGARPGHVERDITLAREPQLDRRPAYPELDEWDVETVLIHELGHAAGNAGHVEGCSSPLTTYGSPGDWWRTPQDRFVRRCIRVTDGPARASAASARPRLRFEHRTVVVRRVETVVVGRG